MAKQTFTTGQVLTAAQMTSLQETAMGGGPATAKVASYVLVAADAGTTVAMNAVGATTITVNTGLFAAGDTVFIQNLGAGACTVTAGTATVATAGSLILPQNDAGILYFTSASAAIFYDYIQAGAVSPLTTKGDLYTFSTSDARLGVGANGTTLVADSAEATGLKWATPTSSSGLTLISTTTMSAVASQSINDVFSTTYDNYRILINATTLTGTLTMRFRVSGSDNTTSNYKMDLYGTSLWTSSTYAGYQESGSTNFNNLGEASPSSISLDVLNPFATQKTFLHGQTSQNDRGRAYQGIFDATTSFTGFSLIPATNITGNVSVYGYNK